MAEIQIFELSEVADLLDLTPSTVKNWTIGRPLTIKPSIRASRGKGSRNLYSRDDVRVLALAAQLSRDGFAPNTVQKVLKELKGRSHLLGSPLSALVISSSGGKPEIKFLSGGSITIGVYEQLRADLIGRYVLNLAKLVSWVDGRIAKVPGAPHH
jgi:DNA-binding transcriptional MerR regulator